MRPRWPATWLHPLDDAALGLLQTRVFVVKDDQNTQAFVMACWRSLAIHDIFTFSAGTATLLQLVLLSVQGYILELPN